MPVFLSPDSTDEMWDLSDEAFRAHVMALVVSQKRRLNQRIPKESAFTSAEVAAELVSSGWWREEPDVWDISVRQRGLWRLRTQANPEAQLIRDRDTSARRRDGLNVAVRDRDGSRCVHCGTAQNLSIDHIYPLSRGGCREMANLQTLCRSCNSRKGSRLIGGTSCCGARNNRCDSVVLDPSRQQNDIESGYES